MLRHAIKLIYTRTAWENERLLIWVVAIMLTKLCSMASFELVLEAKFEVLFGGILGLYGDYIGVTLG